MKTQINLKIDAAVKRSAQKQAKQLGLSLSAVVNATLSQFARTGELQLTTTPRMTSHLEKIVAEARKEHEEGKSIGPFATADDMIASLEK